MNRKIIIGVLILAAVAFIVTPLLKNNSGGDDEKLPAVFTFESNLATKWDERVDIEIAIQSDDIKTLELIYNDSVFHSWSAPKGKLTVQFNAGYFGLGTRTMELKSTLSDGTVKTDSRMVRVLSDVVPEIWIAKRMNEYPHLTTSFTQGLEFNDGQLYEGTGQKGQSVVAKVNLQSGQHQQSMGLDGNYFGEGITVFGNNVYQLTWQEQKCFVYNKQTLQMEKEFSYTGEGWGLCNDGKSLVMSNGTERLTFRNPKTFEVERTIEVYTHQGPVTSLNELEFVDGLIYANVWMTNKVAVINPINGKVLAEIDATDLVLEGKQGGDVLNGIAYNAKTKKWYMTGKNWPKLFEVFFQKSAA